MLRFLVIAIIVGSAVSAHAQQPTRFIDQNGGMTTFVPAGRGTYQVIQTPGLMPVPNLMQEPSMAPRDYELRRNPGGLIDRMFGR